MWILKRRRMQYRMGISRYFVTTDNPMTASEKIEDPQSTEE
jgi:hypothetical protein